MDRVLDLDSVADLILEKVSYREKYIYLVDALVAELKWSRKVIEAARKYAAAEYIGADYNDWEQFTNALKELDGDK